jgi:protease-4
MNARWRVVFGCLGCFTLLMVLVAFFVFAFALREIAFPKVAVLPVEGLLLSGESEISLTMDVTGSRTVSRLLRRAAQDAQIRALVVYVDSPGGSAAAAQEIFEAIQRFKNRTGRPVVAAMGDVAASGGYYVAAAADKIYALPSTLTGSIGAIWQSVNMEKLLAQLGIRAETLKAGRFKDTGSLFRPMTPQERELLQQLLNDVHEQFIADVAKGRRLPVAKVRAVADGRILTGRMALKVGLVDELGALDDAIQFARRQANLPADAPIVTLKERRSLFDRFFGVAAPLPFPRALATEPLLLHMDGRLGIGVSALLWQGMANLR